MSVQAPVSLFHGGISKIFALSNLDNLTFELRTRLIVKVIAFITKAVIGVAHHHSARHENSNEYQPAVLLHVDFLGVE